MYLFLAGILTSCLGLIVACTSLSQKGISITQGNGKPTAQFTQSKQQETKHKKIDPGLSDPAFKKLNTEVLAYLNTLAEAFSSKNKSLLLAQAEPYYQKTYENLYPVNEYLAMLYRIGPYSTETPFGFTKRPALNINEITGITYTGWDELGPVLEVRGKIFFQNGKAEPCRIILLWRLGEIKIKGFEP
ncbi:hypothetical protein [Gracilinema caldarium]|nr:hypothetical protein [Gracilinema caldarium]